MNTDTTTRTNDQDLRDAVDAVAHELELIVEGSLVWDGNGGEPIHRDDVDEDLLDDLDDFGLTDWLGEQLDWHLRGTKGWGTDWEADGVVITVCTGGPGIWVSTCYGEAGVHGGWGGLTAFAPLSDAVLSALDELSEMLLTA